MEFKEIQEITKDIYALLCEEDKAVLTKYAIQVPENGSIVDIGTARGGSAFVMALAAKKSVKIITIDPVEDSSFYTSRESLGLVDKIMYISKTSQDAYNDFGKQIGTIDMVFIDGMHTYDGVLNDFKTWGSKVKQGGIIAFHDVLLYDNTIGKAVQELVTTNEIEEIETIIAKYKDDIRDIGLFIGRKL